MKKVFIIFFTVVFIARVFFVFQKINTYEGKEVLIKGRVLSEPVLYEKTQSFNLKGFKIYAKRFPQVNYGDYLEVRGIVEDRKIKKAEIINLENTNNILFLFRQNLLNVYKHSLPAPHSALVSGVTIGSKSQINSDFYEELKKSGTLHVVVASGMNVTLVAGFLMTLFASLVSRKVAVIVSLAGIWIYALVSGFDSPIVRASIMGSIAFSAQILGKEYFAMIALGATSIIMIFLNPLIILDWGFILSVGATLSLMLFYTPLNSLIALKIKLLPNILKEDFITSLSAQVIVAPLLFLFFGNFNIFSPFINAIVLWTIPSITIIGIVGGILGTIYFPLGKLVLFLIYPFSLWFNICIKFFGNIF